MFFLNGLKQDLHLGYFGLKEGKDLSLGNKNIKHVDAK